MADDMWPEIPAQHKPKKMIIALTDRERLAILFELQGALETVNQSLASGDTSFAGEDEMLMLLIAKLQDNDNSRYI